MRLGAAFFAIVNAYFLTKGLQHYEAFFMITTVEGALLGCIEAHFLNDETYGIVTGIVLHDLEKLNVHILHNMAGSMILSASLSGAIVLRDVYELPSWRIALYSLSVMVVILGILANTETTRNLET